MDLELIMTIILLAIMGVSILVGLIQGVKKNTYGLLFTILFWVFFWITAPLAKGTDFWYGESNFNNIASSLDIDTAKYSCLMDYIKGMLVENANIDSSVLADPSFENTIVAIGMCIAKIFYLIELAIIFAIVKFIVYHVIVKRFIKFDKNKINNLKEKQEEYVQQNHEESEKINKQLKLAKVEEKVHKLNRPLGLASGALRGLLSSFLILCVVNSLVRMLPEDNNNDIIASTQDSQITPSIYDFILSYTDNDPNVASTIDSIKKYQQSGLINLTALKIGDRTADEVFMDSILSGKSKDYSFALRKELKSMTQIATEVFYLTDGFNIENVNWNNLSTSQIKNIQTILHILSNDDLLNNLGTTAVGIALSLDAVKPYMPSNLNLGVYKDINWGNELKTIATLVENVYDLGDLSTLNYLDLDPEKVENLITNLSKLESINLLGHIATSFAIKTMVIDNPDFEKEINSIEEKLANLAANNGYSQTIASYASLYGDFIELFKEIDFDKYKDEEGLINYISALTSIDTTKYSNIVNSVLESNFVSEILPDVLTIMKETIIPRDYASLINPSVVTSSQWEKEINTLLKIVNDLTTNPETLEKVPFDTIDNYDFATLNNFTSETIIQSDLLSYAMFKIMIDTSKNEGILSSEDGGLSNYINIPDYLTVSADDNYKFASKWYGNEANNYEDGELYIMLETIKNCASNLENLNNPIESLPAIIGAIDSNQLFNSDVLHYSLSNMINSVNQFIIVPVSETSKKIVNEKPIDLINKDSLKELVDVITDKDIINLESMFSYFEVDEEGNVAETPTKNEDKDEEKTYVIKLELSTDTIFGLLTSDDLYDSSNNDQSKLDKLFTSKILRATMSNMLTSFTGDLIVVPENSKDSSSQCFISDEYGNKEIIEVDIIKKSQFKSLVMAINDLNIDLKEISNDPIKIIDSFVENKSIKEEAKVLLGKQGYTHSKYSGILHATLSKFILDSTSGPISIVVPNEALDSADSTLIKSDEVVKLINSLAIIGTDIFLDSSGDSENVINNLLTCVIENNETLDSVIIRATLTNYITNSEFDLQIPESAYDETILSSNVISEDDIVDLLNAFKALKDSSNEDITYYDLLDVNNLTISTIQKAEELNGNPISNSLILRGILTQQLSDNDINIPTEAKEYVDAISVSETHNLLLSLTKLLDGNDSLANININSLTLKDLKDAKQYIKESIIIKASLTDSLMKAQDSLVIPSFALDSSITSTSVITNTEIDYLISSLVTMLDENTTINNSSNVIQIELSKLYEGMEDLSSSAILRATITKELLNYDDMIVINKSSVDSSINDYITIKKQSFVELIDALLALNITKLSDFSIDSVVLNSEKANEIAKSEIVRATLTKNLNINDISLYALENEIEIISDYKNNQLLSLNYDGVYNLIIAASCLSETGKLNFEVDVYSITNNLSNIDKILNSSVMLIALSDILLEENSWFVTPVYQKAYKLPDGLSTVSKKILSKENVKKLAEYLS